MKHLAFSLLLGLGLVLGSAGCEPEPCREFRQLICKHCGPKSPACKEVKKRRGRDDKKCKSGVAHVKARVKTAKGKKTLCTLLNSDLRKSRKK